jgi:hypothetical protein
MGSPSNGDQVDAHLLHAVLESKSVFLPQNFWSPFDLHVLGHVQQTLLARCINIDRDEMCAHLEKMEKAFSQFMVNSEIHILI